MGGRNYERLEIIPFGRQLIESGDLDPVYIALSKGIDDADQQSRWLIAYWCFYHCGLASWMSEHEGLDFWHQMMVAAVNEVPSPAGGRWPRGHERRHARGDQAVRMVGHLQERYGAKPQDMIYIMSNLCKGGIMFPELAKHIKTHAQFGPWIAFKIGDMLERVLGLPVNFEESAVFMFKDPAEAAIRLWRRVHDLPDNVRPKNAQMRELILHEVVSFLTSAFDGLGAPPTYDRSIELQEVETVLCKWKSHMNGHYPLLNDIDEIRAGLEGWGETAGVFAHNMPKGSQ